MRQVLKLTCCVFILLFMTACGSEHNLQDNEIPTLAVEETAEAQSSEQIKSSEIQTASNEAVIEDEITSLQEVAETDIQIEGEETTVTKMNVQIGSTIFTATLEQNEAVEELVSMMQEAPVVLQLNDYAGFEKVGSLGTSLTSDDEQTTTHSGDIVLYNSSQIVIFYGSNSWSYTRLGRIDDLSGWTDALGSGSVEVTLSISK